MINSVLDSKKNRKHAAYPSVHYTVCDSLFRYAEFLGFGDIHIKFDEETGLKAIVAIHNLNRGPAIGGCRMVPYQTIDKAIEDALRLGYMMSYKAAINNLAHGGGKAVLIQPKVIRDRDAYFEKFGEFVNELGGRYITAVDSGTSPAEMDIISRKTPYVTCTSQSGSANDPSPLTAIGVRRGIEAAVKFKLNRDSLDGIHISIQGAGHVGYWLAKELHERGAVLTMSDINPIALQRCVDELGVATCLPDDIYQVEADVFSPCALGSILNRTTISQLRTPIVAGSANNQLSHRLYGTLMHEHGILYAPDFLINAGGLIHVATIYDHGDMKKSLEKIDSIYNQVYEIFERAEKENGSTNEIAEKIALDRLKSKQE
jgi:leucine dehydrogenase